MITLLKRSALAWVLLLMLSAVAPWAATAQPSVSVTYQTFYDELSPYGRWVQDPDYGYVWLPNVGPDFQPYSTNGYWAMTEYGNTWVSNYDWGWAPFHYGRWRYSDYYGWSWLPGTEWGPAWVSWRSGGGYYGWAPLGPSVNINLSFGPRYVVPNTAWVFVPQQYLVSPRWHDYYVRPARNVTIINHTTIINNTYVRNNCTYVAGPRRNELEAVTRSRVNVYNVSNVNRPGRVAVRQNALGFYRPDVRAGRADAPRTVERRFDNGADNRDNYQRRERGRVVNAGAGNRPDYGTPQDFRNASTYDQPRPLADASRAYPAQQPERQERFGEAAASEGTGRPSWEGYGGRGRVGQNGGVQPERQLSQPREQGQWQRTERVPQRQQMAPRRQQMPQPQGSRGEDRESSRTLERGGGGRGRVR